MPYNVHNRGVEIPACSRQVSHGELTYESGFVGVAVKQKGYTIETPRSEVTVIKVGEQFFLITKGTVEVPGIAGAELGQEVSITTATGVVTLGAPGAGQVKVGRVAVLPGQYGSPSGPAGMGSYPVIPTHGFMRVDLDSKDSL